MLRGINQYKWSSYSQYLNKSKNQIFDRDKNKVKTIFREFHKIEEDIECLEVKDKKGLKIEKLKKLLLKYVMYYIVKICRNLMKMKEMIN